jgi:hypothetical protein
MYSPDCCVVAAFCLRGVRDTAQHFAVDHQDDLASTAARTPVRCQQLPEVERLLLGNRQLARCDSRGCIRFRRSLRRRRREPWNARAASACQ